MSEVLVTKIGIVFARMPMMSESEETEYCCFLNGGMNRPRVSAIKLDEFDDVSGLSNENISTMAMEQRVPWHFLGFYN